MSMNENLEVKVSELTNVIRGLSDRPVLSPSDINNLINSLVQKVEDANEAGLNKLTDDVSESMLNILEEKYREVNERLSVFEEFVTSVEKNIQNPKLEGEITRILNDIEALHSKMNSQELQTEGLVKSFDSMKNSSGAGQITKLCDEIVSISKSYDGIVEVLNNNFQEFLRKVETSSSREEIQRLRYFLESVEGNQNVLVSAMNAVNDKQEEIKNLIRQSSNVQNIERFEALQAGLNQLNKSIIDTTSKADLEIISDKIEAAQNLINEFRRTFDENLENDVRSVMQGQLNNIISRLESLKLDNTSNVNEDIIRLYTSIAEFKDGLYSAINTQLNDVIASVDVQFDKISNSMLNASMDTNELIANMTGEVQKLNSITTEGLNAKTLEIKQDMQKTSQENIITVVNSIKGELSSLINEISAMNSSDAIIQLANNIESLKNGLDIDSLLIQMDQIKSALDLGPVKEQLMLLNKDEAINSINQKIDLILDFSRNNEVLSRLDEINSKTNLDSVYSALDSINQKIDFTSIEEKISGLKTFLENTDFSGDINSIREKLSLIDDISDELVSLKNIDTALLEIKQKLDESFILNSEKFNENKEAQDDIKEALKTIYQTLSLQDFEKFEGLLSSIKENIEFVSSKISEFQNTSLENKIDKLSENLAFIEDKIEEQKNNPNQIKGFEDALNTLNENLKDALSKTNESVFNLNSSLENILNSLNENINNLSSKTFEARNSDNAIISDSFNMVNDKLNLIDLKVSEKDDSKINEIKEQIEFLNEFVKNINFNSINEEIESLEQNILTSSADNIKEIKDNLQSFENSFTEAFRGLKELFVENENKEASSETITGVFSEFETRLNDKILSLETLIEETGNITDEKHKNTLSEKLFDIKEQINSSFAEIIEQTLNSRVEFLNDFIKTQMTETRSEIGNYIKQENEILSSYFTEKTEYTQKDTLNKIVQILNAKENSEARINLIKSTTNSLAEILNNTNLLKSGFESNGEALNNISQTFDMINSKFEEYLNKENSNAQSAIEALNKNLGDIEARIFQASDEINKNAETNMDFVCDSIKSTESKITDKINEADVENKETLKTIKDGIESLNSKILESASNNNVTGLEVALNTLAENVRGVQTDLKETIDTNAVSLEKETNALREGINEAQNKITEIIDEKTNSTEEKINSIKSGFGVIERKIQNVSDEIKTGVGEKFDTIEAKGDIIKAEIADLISQNNSDIKASINELSEGVISGNSKLNETIVETGANIENAISSINENINSINSKIAEVNSKNDSSLTDVVDDISRGVENLISATDRMNQSRENNFNDLSGLMRGLEELVGNSNVQAKDKMEDIKNAIISSILSETLKDENLENAKNSIIQALNSSLEDKNSNIQNKIEEVSGHIHANINGAREKIEEIKNDFNSETNKILEELKKEAESVKSSIGSEFEKNRNAKESLENLTTMFEQKLQEKVLMLESIMDEGVSKFDERTEEAININSESYKDNLDEKINFAILQLSADFEAKMSDIQKIIDDKVYEIVSRNNEIIKDELKLRADATLRDISKDFKDKISKIESVLVKDENTEEEETEQTYTLADVESDIAKIRLSLEKNNKLSNFKEFASRLVELKNINLENAKISRVIGADIMRFDSWLKNTTAKIDVLAAKIEKSEKIKMEDLKTRLIQSEKNQAMPQKLEEAIMSIYKKYRTQETKIEEMINKVDNLAQRQTESFDVKEFIDLFYDNTKKTQDLMSRMDGIEDKMDLIQAKIDHIISSCIDE